MSRKVFTIATGSSLLFLLGACADVDNVRIQPDLPQDVPRLSDAFEGEVKQDVMPAAVVSREQRSLAPVDETDAGIGEDSMDAGEQLNALFQQYFQEGLELNPLQGTFLGMNEYNDKWVNFLSQDYRERNRAFESGWLDRVRQIDRSQLSGQDLISYDIFLYQQNQFLRGTEYPDHLIPISQFFSLPSFMATLGSGQSAQPFATVEDYDNWYRRMEGIPTTLDQAIVNMRAGVQADVVQPRVLMVKVLPQLQAMLVDDVEDSLFWQPIANMPKTFSDADRERVTAAYRERLTDSVLPAYRRLHDYINDDYLPATRDTVGTSALPDGRDWYNYLIATNTTTELTADEIHQFGLDEVARIRREMMEVADTVGFDGTLEDFFAMLKSNDDFYYDNEEDLLEGYRALQDTVNEKLPALFDVFPKADYEVRAVEPFRAESSAGAFYQRPTPDGSRPGVFYVNTFNLRAQPKYGMETLSLHEASPGHHFQIAIQQEITGLPAFRRFGGYTAFSEGWALYAESLGREMGMFTDPYQYFGRLSDEMLRAMRLVVDTGLHAKGWSREQAIDYMTANSDMAESDVVAEVERYIAIPGQALAYKVGQRAINELREEAETALGEDFDIRAFHRVVLTGGAMPLEVLKRRVRSWIEAEQMNS